MLDYVTISTQEAQSHFAELGERAARGEHIVVTRGQEPWFVMGPPEDARAMDEARRERQGNAIRDMIELGKTIRAKHGPTTAEEIKSWINEGRRF